MKYFVKCSVMNGMFKAQKMILLISVGQEVIFGFVPEEKTRGKAVEVNVIKKIKNKVLVDIFCTRDIYPEQRFWVKKNQLMIIGKRKK